MTCPTGISWSKVKTSSNFAHEEKRECSDGGICDTSTGECTCFPGFEGSACQRTACPNDCSEQGTVDPTNIAVSSYYDYFLVTYDNAWDAGMQYGCLCDIGFRGVDCSEIECPTTYDAMDKESCTKYGEWEEKGTYAYNFKDGASPSLTTFQGNTVLIR